MLDRDQRQAFLRQARRYDYLDGKLDSLQMGLSEGDYAPLVDEMEHIEFLLSKLLKRQV